MFGVTCTCSWLELFVVIWSWVKNDAAPFLGVGGLVGGYRILTHDYLIVQDKNVNQVSCHRNKVNNLVIFRIGSN